MAEDLLLETREVGDWSVVEVSGELDLYTAPQLKERLSDLAGAGRVRQAVELSGVEFLDSTALGVLIGALKRCRENGGALSLVSPTEPVRKVLSITGLDKVFSVHQSVEEATASL